MIFSPGIDNLSFYYQCCQRFVYFIIFFSWEHLWYIASSSLFVVVFNCLDPIFSISFLLLFKKGLFYYFNYVYGGYYTHGLSAHSD